ncbi:MFS transporter [Vibrio coralliilyticus]|uniref:MFS transporter n=1 Tax=Vibrio coralliilyticus TaxID=190893 RepID=UPI0024091954|nr:MFS transporter [Vibrio coralliilyticus]WFB49503.1 MFS transporter [Vibrio coralliilyticus]
MSVVKNTRIQLSVIGLIAALMGIGQNGLLVSLPFLVEHSAFALPTWSILIAVGSFLFLPAAPYWGRHSDQFGPKRVVIQALLGMAVSFLLLLVFAVLSAQGQQWIGLCLAGLVLARIIYGCTVAGMVPASQHWAILLCGEQNRIQAITSVSIGLSTGRLLGPLLSIVLLKFSPFAPLMVMVLFPVLALMGAYWLPSPPLDKPCTGKEKPRPSWIPNAPLMPFLLSGLLLCAVIALLQYSFSPLIFSVTEWPTDQISNAIGILLTISAAMTLSTQILVIKKKKLTPTAMYQLGGLAMLTGFVLFLIPNIWLFGVAMAIAASGAALLVPAYTAKATETDKSSPGAISGYISMSHTLGYGFASLLAYSATINPIYPIYICVGFSAIILTIALKQRSAGALETQG